jgi:hypothetical protein
VSPVKYELGTYITEDEILHNQSRENLKSYSVFYLERQIKMYNYTRLYKNIQF